MIDHILDAYDENIGRVRRLLQLSLAVERITMEENKEIVSNTQRDDILRASVVFLHSTLEDFLRSLLKLKLPESGNLKNIPLYDPENANNRTKFDLGELSSHRGKTVDELITLSVHQYLDTESFSNTKQIIAYIRKIDLQKTETMQDSCAVLDEMISRRHHIVHQADRSNGTDSNSFQNIKFTQVESWIVSTEAFIIEIINQLK